MEKGRLDDLDSGIDMPRYPGMRGLGSDGYSENKTAGPLWFVDH